MPEVTLAPATSANADTTVGDATYVTSANVAGVESDDATHSFGRDDDKTAENHGAIQHYDTSSIPLNAEVSRAMIQVKASATESGSFTADVDVLARSTRNDQVTVQQHDAQALYLPDYAVYPAQSLWSDYVMTSPTKFIEMPLNTEFGIGGVSQVWVADTSAGSALFAHYWWLKRTGALSSTTVRTRVYEADGSSGSYVKGDLIDDGVDRDADLITTGGAGFWNELEDTTWVPTTGTSYISEITFDGGSGADTVSVGLRISSSVGSAQNMSVVARTNHTVPRVLQGFGGYTQYLAASRIVSASKSGTTDSVSSFPAFTSGTVYSFGSSEFSGTSDFTTLTNFKANLQSALDARTSTDHWSAVRVQDATGTTDNRRRQFHSSKSATTTSGSQKGMLLTVTWSVPSTVSVSSLDGAVNAASSINQSNPAIASVSNFAASVSYDVSLTQGSPQEVSAASFAGTVPLDTAAVQPDTSLVSATSLAGEVSLSVSLSQALPSSLSVVVYPSVVFWDAPTNTHSDLTADGESQTLGVSGTGASQHPTLTADGESQTLGVSGTGASQHSTLTGTGDKTKPVSGGSS